MYMYVCTCSDWTANTACERERSDTRSLVFLRSGLLAKGSVRSSREVNHLYMVFVAPNFLRDNETE